MQIDASLHIFKRHLSLGNLDRCSLINTHNLYPSFQTAAFWASRHRVLVVTFNFCIAAVYKIMWRCRRYLISISGTNFHRNSRSIQPLFYHCSKWVMVTVATGMSYQKHVVYAMTKEKGGLGKSDSKLLLEWWPKVSSFSFLNHICSFFHYSFFKHE